MIRAHDDGRHSFFSFSFPRRIAYVLALGGGVLRLRSWGRLGTAADVTFGFVHKAGSGLGEYNETCPDLSCAEVPTGEEGRNWA
jgi:hypothetical protein